MNTKPRSPSEHYQEAERLLTVAESATIDPGMRDLSARLAIGHGLLATAPRRARKIQKAPQPPARHSSATDRWLYGTDDKEN